MLPVCSSIRLQPIKLYGAKKFRFCKLPTLMFGVVAFSVLIICQQHNRLSSLFYYTSIGRIGNSPKTVVILTYQRCGSSFLGQLFNLDGRVFYMFEPLDGLYSSMYGIQPGWSVPSNIVTHRNGTERVIPPFEVIAVSNFLADLFNCNVSKLPTEFMIHSFWELFRGEMASTTNYSDCLLGLDVMAEQRDCYGHLRHFCSTEFGRNGPERDERCYRSLHHDRESADGKSVDLYADCKYTHRLRVDGQCSASLQSTCSKRSIRVVKVVRASMESMRALLRLLPETRVIHLVRDPRAVSLSRYRFDPSGRGLYTRAASNRSEQIVREASIYCRQVVADVQWRQRLEREFPDRFYSLTYEQLVVDPFGRASDIYRFVGEADVPPETARNFTFLAETGNGNVTAKKLASTWRRKLTTDKQRLVNEHCTEFMELFPAYMDTEDS